MRGDALGGHLKRGQKDDQSKLKKPECILIFKMVLVVSRLSTQSQHSLCCRLLMKLLVFGLGMSNNGDVLLVTM